MNNREIYFLLAVIGFILLTGCTDLMQTQTPTTSTPHHRVSESSESPQVTVELIDSINISLNDVLFDESTIESKIRNEHAWVYSRNGLKENIKENTTFIMRIHFSYPLDKESYSTGARINIEYYPDIIEIITPVFSEYELIDAYHKKGPEGGLIRVNEYRYGAYGELRSGEDRDVILIGVTKELKYLWEGETPIYLGISIYREGIINGNTSIRVVE